MKRRTKITILFILTALIALGVAFKTPIANGISRIRIPFGLLSTETRGERVPESKVKLVGLDANQLQKRHSDILNKDWSLDKSHSISKLNVSNEKNFQELVNNTYGVDWTYFGKVAITGAQLDEKGWHALITFSVFNDTNTVDNLTYNMKDFTKVSEVKSGYWTKPLDSIDVDLNDINNQIQGVLTNQSNTNQNRFNLPGNLKPFLSNNSLTSVTVQSFPTVLTFEYQVGTKREIKNIKVTYDYKKNEILDVKEG